jgi:SAM-dependent methyltransferase
MGPNVIDWDTEYALGIQDGHRDSERLVRYAMLGHIIARHRATQVLDVGCGQGMLRRFLPPGISYTGLDPSRRALGALGDDDRRICARLEEWVPDTRYDCVVANEVLYYCENIPAALEVIDTALAPDGLLVVSIFHKGWGSANRRALRAVRQFLAGAWTITDDLELVEEGERRFVIAARRNRES